MHLSSRQQHHRIHGSCTLLKMKVKVNITLSLFDKAKSWSRPLKSVANVAITHVRIITSFSRSKVSNSNNNFVILHNFKCNRARHRSWKTNVQSMFSIAKKSNVLKYVNLAVCLHDSK